jgi:hypothetical protein
MATKKKEVKKVVIKKPLVKKVEENVRKLQKQGNGTMTVALPADLVRELKWKDKQKLVVRKNGVTLVIADWKK